MKSPYRVDVVLSAGVLLSIFLTLAIDYIGGRRNFPVAFLLFPAGLLPSLLSVVCLLALLVRMVLSGSIKIVSVRAAFFSLSLFVFLFFWIYFPPPRVFLQGLRAALRSRSTVSEIEASVSSIRQHPQTHPNIIPSPNFLADYRVQQDDDSTSVFWGGALVGHWGIRYSDTPTEGSSGDISFLPLSEHTGLFYSE
jgi:hypothetical protein